jgi:hypothetical protein
MLFAGRGQLLVGLHHRLRVHLFLSLLGLANDGHAVRTMQRQVRVSVVKRITPSLCLRDEYILQVDFYVRAALFQVTSRRSVHRT